MRSPSEEPDEVDRLLRQAGADWRAAQPAAPEPDLSAGRGGRRRNWVPLLAAAAVAIIAVGAITWPDRESGTPVATSTPRPTGPQAELVVRDGDLVEVTGQVIAAPGQPVYFCSPMPGTMALPARPTPSPGSKRAPACGGSRAILTGVDLDRLVSSGTAQGVRYGQATLRGTWRAGTIEVSEQSAPRTATVTTSPPRPTPCAAPAGGWTRTPWGDGLPTQTVTDYLDAHPDRFGPGWITYPYGPPDVDPRPPAGKVAEVFVVPVTNGEVDKERQQLRRRFGGNLCVIRGTVSSADVSRIVAEIGALRENPANGLNIVGIGSGDRPVTVGLVVLDERVYGELARIGIDKMTLEPQVRRVG